ncbi:MAG: hypothetical protein OSB75_05865 [Dehalococcoidia bacterium]|nr:hypothetical protein [Dehalococcoidia bacterium]
MFENVSEHLDEAVRLAERCPEKYQIPCFEALIRVLAQSDSLPAQSAEDSHLLNGNGSNGSTNGGTTGVSSGSYNNPVFNSAPNNGQQQSGERGPIFMDQHQIPEAFISRVYHLDGNSYRIIVKDLKEKTNSKKQVKLALLLGIGGLLATGQPVFSKERLIEACREYGAYDAPNFASHMKKQRDMFISHGNDWSLTVPAQQRAAEAIKELAN